MLVRNRTRTDRRRRAGFTLMEILVVVAIIIAVAAVGGYALMGQLRTSRVDAARAQIQVVSKAVDTYMLRNHGTPPASLEILLQPDPMNGNSPYLENPDNLRDPYGNIFQYDPAGQQSMQYTGVVAQRPDVFFIDQATGEVVGNWAVRK